jgi:phosphate transport system permease protein
MTDTATGPRRIDFAGPAAQARLRARYRAEARFRLYGLAAIALTALFLVAVLADIVWKGYPAFTQSMLTLPVAVDAAEIDPKGTRDPAEIGAGDFQLLTRDALRARVLADPALIGGTVTLALPLSSDADIYFKGLESFRHMDERLTGWLDTLRERGLVARRFNTTFFTAGDSREPELAGIRGALVGSALTLLVTLVLCLPVGVAGAIYLEEFAPRNRFTELIEVNINNLAAVPSIVFGLLGLAVFLNFFGLPRSAPLVGGLVLALLVLPTIIIAARAALRAVPPSIKEAALGVGASHQQAVFHHVLPLAMPGIMTGTIIGMAHALGETAPLLMIGMVAFIVETPLSLTDAATVLPVQIFLWSDLPEVGFRARTAAAILVLLAFLFVMNGIAIVVRRRFERRW